MGGIEAEAGNITQKMCHAGHQNILDLGIHHNG